MYIGGVPHFNEEGMTIKYNFKGCVQNINFNGAKLIRDALDGSVATISLMNNVNRFCNVSCFSILYVTCYKLLRFLQLLSILKTVCKYSAHVNVSIERDSEA